MNLNNFLRSKKGHAGTFTTLGDIRSWNGRIGSSFVFNNSLYIVRANDLPVGVVEDTAKIIILNNGNVGFNSSSRAWYGTYYGQDVITPNNNNSFRLPETKRVTGTGTSFPLAAATAAFGGSPVNGDIVEFASTTAPNFTEARYFNASNSTWTKIPNEINGVTFNFGVLGASRVQTLSLITNSIRSRKLELVDTVNMEVRNPDGFGPNNLVYWLGAKAGKIDGNGNIDYSLLTAANALQWISKTGSSMLGSTPPTEPDPNNNGGNVIFNAPSTINGAGSYNYNATTTLQVDFLTNGQWGSSVVNGNVTGGTTVLPYLQNTGNNYGNDYEICIEKISGDTVTGTTGNSGANVFVPLNVTRNISISVTAGAVGTTETRSANIRVIIRQISNPSNAITDTFTMNVSRELTAAAANGGNVANQLNLGSAYSSYDTETVPDANAQVVFNFNANGTYDVQVSPFSSGAPLSGNFLTNTGTNYANDYEIKVEYVSGSGVVVVSGVIAAFDQFYPITSTAQVMVQAYVNSTNTTISKNVNLRFTVRQISNPSNVSSRTVNVVAQAAVSAAASSGGAVTGVIGTNYTSSRTVTGAGANSSTTVSFATNGTMSVAGDNLSGSPTSGSYLQNTGSGYGNNYEISISQVSGSPINGVTSGFVSLNTQRQIILTASVAAASGGTSSSQALDGIVSVTIREVGNTSNSSTSQIRLRSTATSNPSVSSGGNVVGTSRSYNITANTVGSTARAAGYVILRQSGTLNVSTSGNSLGAGNPTGSSLTGSWMANPGSYGSAYSYTATSNRGLNESGTLSSDVAFSALAQTTDATVGNTTSQTETVTVNIWETNNPSNSATLTFSFSCTATAASAAAAGGNVLSVGGSAQVTSTATGTTARAIGVLQFNSNGTFGFSSGSGLGTAVVNTDHDGNYLTNTGSGYGAAYTIQVSGSGISTGTTGGTSLSSGHSIVIQSPDASPGNTLATNATVNITIFETANPANTASFSVAISANAVSNLQQENAVSLSGLSSSVTNSVTQTNSVVDSTSSILFSSNGSGSSFGSSNGSFNWFSGAFGSDGADYEISVTRLSGDSLSNGETTGYVSLASGHGIALTVQALAGNTVSRSATISISIRQITNPSNSASKTVTISATATANAAAPAVSITGTGLANRSDLTSNYNGADSLSQVFTEFYADGTYIQQTTTGGVVSSGRWTSSSNGSLYEISVVKNSQSGSGYSYPGTGGFVNFPVSMEVSASSTYLGGNINSNSHNANYTVTIRAKANTSNSTSATFTMTATARTYENAEP